MLNYHVFFAMFFYFSCMYIFLMIGLGGSLSSKLDDRGWFKGYNKLSPQPLETSFSIYLLSREDVWYRELRCRSLPLDKFSQVFLIELQGKLPSLGNIFVENFHQPRSRFLTSGYFLV